MKARIVSSFFTAVTMAMCCLSVNVSAETESPVTNVTVVERQYLAGSAKTDISKLTFGKIGNKVYTGKELKPSVTIKNGSTKLKSGTDYTISYKNNKKIGTATITIKGKGNYIGTKRLTFNIVPGKTAVSAHRSDDKISLTWDKIKGATGYQLYYSENGGKFSKLKTTTKTSFSTTKLSKDSSFQFKVRAYTKVNAKTYYGSFSDVIEVSKVNTADISIAIKDLGNKFELKMSGLDFSKIIDPLNGKGDNLCNNSDDKLYIGMYDSSEIYPFFMLSAELSNKSVQSFDFYIPPMRPAISKWDYKLNDSKDSIVITIYSPYDDFSFFADNTHHSLSTLSSLSKDCVIAITSSSFNYTSSKEYANQTKPTFLGDMYFGDYKDISITWQ